MKSRDSFENLRNGKQGLDECPECWYLPENSLWTGHKGGETYFQWSRPLKQPWKWWGRQKSKWRGTQEDDDSIELKVPKEYKLQGARLAIMTQKLAYDWITQLKELRTITRKWQENLKDTMDALKDSGSPRLQSRNCGKTWNIPK